MPSWLKAQGFVKDRKEAYVYVQRLVKRRGFGEDREVGVYKVRHDVIVRLLQLPVRHISEGIRRARERVKLLTDGEVLDVLGPVGLLGQYMVVGLLGCVVLGIVVCLLIMLGC